MNTTHKILTILLCLLCGAQYTFAQHEKDPHTQDIHEKTQAKDTTAKQIGSYLQQMSKWKQSSQEGNYDSIYAINDSMIAYINTIAKQPVFFSTDYSGLKQYGLQVSKSEDSVCMAMDWEVAQQGNMHYYNGVLYYNTPTGITGGAFTNGICLSLAGTVTTKDNKKVYLLLVKDTYTKNRKEMLLAKSPEMLNGATSFNDILFFYIDDDSSTNLLYTYAVSSFSDSTNIPDITLSEDKKYVYLPVVQTDGTFINKYKVYKYEGDKFVYKKTSKNK